MPEIETGTEARQGRKGMPVLYVLIGTMVLCVLATVGVLVWQGASSPKDWPSPSQEAARGTVGDATTTGSVAKQPGGNPATPPSTGR